MSSTNVTELIVSDHDAYARLPDTTTLIEACVAHNNEAAERDDAVIRGTLLHDRAGTRRIWVKYGRSISMAEARTQDYVARTVNGTRAAEDASVRVPNVYATFRDAFGWTYIVMEFIVGTACRTADGPAVAKALTYLTTISPPSGQTRPGPVGRGPVGNAFFNDRQSPVEYPSCTELQVHINNILRCMKYKGLRVDFTRELAAHGLRLCLSDLTRSNFLKTEDGTIVALDFGEASFLPVCFFRLALLGQDRFTFSLRTLLAREPWENDNVGALIMAAGALVITGKNRLGLPQELR